MKFFTSCLTVSIYVTAGHRLGMKHSPPTLIKSNPNESCPGVELFETMQRLLLCKLPGATGTVCEQYNAAEGAPQAYTYDQLSQTGMYFQEYAPTLTNISRELISRGLSSLGFSGIFAALPNTQTQGGYPFESGEVAWILKTAFPTMDDYAKRNYGDLVLGRVKTHLPKLKEIYSNAWYVYAKDLMHEAQTLQTQQAKYWAYLRAMNYLFIGQWYGLWTETALKINDLSYIAMELAMNHSDLYDMTWHEIPYTTDSNKSVMLRGAFITGNQNNQPRRQLLLGACGGLDWTTPGYLASLMPLLGEGLSVFVYEGPGQGQTIRKHKVAFTPRWDRVVGAVAQYAKHNLDYDKSIGVSHGSPSFAGFLGSQACTSNIKEMEDIKKCYATPTYPSAGKVLMHLVWNGGYDITRVANYLQVNQPEKYAAYKSILYDYQSWYNEGENNVFGPDPLVAAIKECGRLDVLRVNERSPLLAGGNVLFDLHSDYWTYTIGLEYAESQGIVNSEDIFYNDTNYKLVTAWVWEQIALEYQISEEQAASTPGDRQILMMGTQEDSMHAQVTIDSFAKAISRKTGNVPQISKWNASTGGSGHCRVGAFVKSFLNVVSPFLLSRP
mmetsp:Transcript_141/g.334  ORF Transcript_141/g.334 Transcript_141/m.334 type:complete len:610 (+) Transcript_141:107-1936(+)|eukprot:CAMPEP_0203801814 /NCGR_PEP_ID=MMETSP0100_2-20121128/11602_1 /ASSEMBLY_ACC=CAM_ASM_000210 /TAXON_ID=96639 /ORGANISM=" , Strain NY0313808BC1" /LENGTH=609 /DNA_ID=CAMNT_0050708691 /DNA_START=440 /DNA_END=2269 /DNA_ORIENTATION=-